MPQPLAILRDAAAEAVMNHPIRQQVLHALREPGSASSVGAALGLPRQKVNYHLRALETVGLVEHVEDRRKGNCTERIVQATATHYLIDPRVAGELGARPEDVADRLSSEHLAAVSARTVSDIAELRRRAAHAGKRLPTFSIEATVRFASPADQAAFLQSLTDSITKLIERHHDGAANDGREFRLVVGAHPSLPVEHSPQETSEVS